MDDALLAGLVFVLSYAIITTDKVHRTLVALAGALVMIALRVVSQEEAFRAIDFNVVFLLAGMMVIAHVTGTTGVFQWVAVRSAKLVRADPFLMLVALSSVTALVSAFLDNVTTVVLIVPMTLYIASTLRLSPAPFLIAEVLASNIGGTATLVGDPPNILIGSAAGLDFATFLANLAPVALVIFGAFLVTARLTLARDFQASPELRAALLKMDDSSLITDPVLLRRCLIVLGLTVLGFLLHGALGYEPATIALAGAVALLLWSNHDLHEALHGIEWTTLFFFVGLFVMVGAIAKVGLIGILAREVLKVTGSDVAVASLTLLWLSAVLSALVDNIPYTATMIPLVQEMGRYMDVRPLWWALALGADLGGNATLIGAAANVIVANLAERSGHRIAFSQYLKYGALVTFESTVIASVYVWLRYL